MQKWTVMGKWKPNVCFRSENIFKQIAQVISPFCNDRMGLKIRVEIFVKVFKLLMFQKGLFLRLLKAFAQQRLNMITATMFF